MTGANEPALRLLPDVARAGERVAGTPDAS
ncbi:hypothetical protein QF026_007491 [Streptomyces aurantiacus]|nr:hypothetical protein [Streptomyces aurantiacus]